VNHLEFDQCRNISHAHDNASLRTQYEGSNSMSDNPMSAFEARQRYVATHPITLELKKLGVTEEQLTAMRFRARTQERPFDQWSLTWARCRRKRFRSCMLTAPSNTSASMIRLLRKIRITHGDI
jgi:hypothetical protein